MNLRTLNLTATIAHFVLAIGFVIWFNYLNVTYPNNPVQGVELSVRNHSLHLESDQSDNITASWQSNEETTFDIKLIQIMLVVFFLITGCFHLFYYSTDKPGGLYSQAVKTKNNYFRWIEYSITATIMLFIIASVSGVKDSNIYYLIMVSNLVMIMLGQTVETAVRDRKSWWIPMISGFLLLIANFYVITRNLWQRLDEVNQFLQDNQDNPNVNGQTIPSWIKYTVYILFMFYSSFGFLSLYGAQTGKNYDFIEKGYIILSLASKATLGAFVAYGLGQRQNA